MTHDAFSTKRVTVWEQSRGNEPGYAIKYQDGYLSWCPADVYSRDYQPIDAMSFGHALKALQAGEKVARAGWNGKKMYVFLEKGSFPAEWFGFKPDDEIRLDHPSTIDGIGMGLFNPSAQRGEGVRLPRFCMKTASGSIQPGWNASQSDMLANDWMIVTDLLQ